MFVNVTDQLQLVATLVTVVVMGVCTYVLYIRTQKRRYAKGRKKYIKNLVIYDGIMVGVVVSVLTMGLSWVVFGIEVGGGDCVC